MQIYFLFISAVIYIVETPFLKGICGYTSNDFRSLLNVNLLFYLNLIQAVYITCYDVPAKVKFSSFVILSLMLAQFEFVRLANLMGVYRSQ